MIKFNTIIKRLLMLMESGDWTRQYKVVGTLNAPLQIFKTKVLVTQSFLLIMHLSAQPLAFSYMNTYLSLDNRVRVSLPNNHQMRQFLVKYIPNLCMKETEAHLNCFGVNMN